VAEVEPERVAEEGALEPLDWEMIPAKREMGSMGEVYHFTYRKL
jgi:hypothetical protein